MERLRTNPQSVRKIYIQQGFSEAGYIYKKAKQHGISVITVEATRFEKIHRTRNTQGVLVDVDDFKYIPFNQLLDTALEKKLTLVFLDSLNDPQNLGAIIRSLGCFGGFALVLPTHDSVGVTEAVLRVASGGDNYVPISRVANITNAIKSAQESGYQIAGAVVGSGDSLFKTFLPFPLGLVLGSEQKGIRDVVRKFIDIELTIPMPYNMLSFNVAHAASIFCYEITKQKQKAQKAQKSAAADVA